jgi:hypothetical protein
VCGVVCGFVCGNVLVLCWCCGWLCVDVCACVWVCVVVCSCVWVCVVVAWSCAGQRVRRHGGEVRAGPAGPQRCACCARRKGTNTRVAAHLCCVALAHCDVQGVAQHAARERLHLLVVCVCVECVVCACVWIEWIVWVALVVRWTQRGQINANKQQQQKQQRARVACAGRWQPAPRARPRQSGTLQLPCA